MPFKLCLRLSMNCFYLNDFQMFLQYVISPEFAFFPLDAEYSVFVHLQELFESGIYYKIVN